MWSVAKTQYLIKSNWNVGVLIRLYSWTDNACLVEIINSLMIRQVSVFANLGPLKLNKEIVWLAHWKWLTLMGNANASLTILKVGQDFVRDVTNKQMVLSAVEMATEYFDIFSYYFINNK